MFAFSPLWRALLIAYGGPYAIAAGLNVVQDLLTFLQPQLLRWLLSYISNYQDTQSEERPSKLQGFAIAILMFIVSVTQTICLNQVSEVLIHIFYILT
jgi:ATP-binding cassette subfamily C (CFTR/MRP) protein 1